MASAIDPTKPEDGVPANKAELRANLAMARTELEHGGFAQGFTPAAYGPPASEQVKDHLAAIDTALGGLASQGFTGLADTPSSYTTQASRFVKVKADESGLEFPAAPSGSGGLTGWVDVKTDYSAAGNGSTDDTAALQAALDSGAAMVWIPPGTYVISSRLSITPGTTVLGAGVGLAIIDARSITDNSHTGMLHCHGTTVTLPPLALATAEGGREIEFASSIDGDLDTGDWLGILDTRNKSFNGFSSDGHRDGLFLQVLSRSGVNVLPANPVGRQLPSPVVAGGAMADLEAARLDRRGVTIKGIEIIGSGENAWKGVQEAPDEEHTGLEIRHVARVVLEDVKVMGFGRYCIVTDRCADVEIRNCKTGAVTPTSNGPDYGLAINGSGFVRVIGGHFVGQSVGIDVEGGSNSGGPIHQMPSHDVTVIGADISVPASQRNIEPSGGLHAFDSHENVYRILLTGCRINGRVSLRGEDNVVEGNIIFQGDNPNDNPTVGTWRVGPKPGVRIARNLIINFTNNRTIYCDHGPPQDKRPGTIEIVGNTIYQMAGAPDIIRVGGNPGVNATSILIADNVVAVDGGTSNFLLIGSADNNDFVRMVVKANVLSPGLSLGTIADVTTWRGFANFIDDHVVFSNLPTSNPGGSGRLWSDGGTLKIT